MVTLSKALNDLKASAIMLSVAAPRTITAKTKRTIERSTESLQNIAIGQLAEVGPERQELAALVDEFFALANQGVVHLQGRFRSFKDKNRLAYALNVRTENHEPIALTNYLPQALSVCADPWRNAMFAPIFDLYLSRWNSLDGYSKDILSRILRAQSERYSGSKLCIRQATDHPEWFFEKDGCTRFGTNCLQSSILPQDFPTTIGIKGDFESNEFFSEAFVGYVKSFCALAKKPEILPHILAFIEDFGSSKLPVAPGIVKKCLSLLVVAYRKSKKGELDTIARVAFKQVGDPANGQKWRVWPGASDDDKKLLSEARMILTGRVTELFFDLFFKMISPHDRRERFWREYLDEIPFVKIYCSSILLNELSKKRPDLESFFEARLGCLDNAKERDDAVLVMNVNGYVLVEFCQTNNAFYAYRQDGSLCPDITRRTLGTYSLKRPSGMHQITRSKWKTMNEGRLHHSGGWEYNLERWLAHHVHI